MRTSLLKLSMSALLPVCSAVRPSTGATAAAKRVQAKLCSFPHDTNGLKFAPSLAQARRGFAWGAQAQSTVRSTVARAGADSWGFDQGADSDYKVGSIPYDALASNAVSLIGFTGRDVEIKRLQTGNTVGTMPLAVNHKAGETTWCADSACMHQSWLDHAAHCTVCDARMQLTQLHHQIPDLTEACQV